MAFLEVQNTPLGYVNWGGNLWDPYDPRLGPLSTTARAIAANPDMAAAILGYTQSHPVRPGGNAASALGVASGVSAADQNYGQPTAVYNQIPVGAIPQTVMGSMPLPPALLRVPPRRKLPPPTTVIPSGVVAGGAGGAGIAGLDPRVTTGVTGGAPTVIPQVGVTTGGASAKDVTAITKQVMSALNIPYGKLSKQAKADAKREVASQVAMLTAQQRAIEASGRAYAGDIQNAYNAAAALNANLPGILSANYANAARTLGALGAGFSGQLGDIAQQQANQLNAYPGATRLSTGEDVAALPAAVQNTLNYPFNAPGGPAAGLVTAGTSAANEAAYLPPMMRGAGLAASRLALAGTAAQAAQLNPDIAATIASLPKLTQANLTALLSGAQKGVTSKLQALKLIQSLGGGGMTPYQAASLKLRADTANQSAAIATARINATGHGAGSGPHLHFYQDAQTGQTRFVNTDDGTFGVLPGGSKPPKAGKSAKITPYQVSQLYKGLPDWINLQRHGIYSTFSSRGKAQNIVKQAPVSAADAWRAAILKYQGLIRSDPGALDAILAAIEAAYGGNYAIDRSGALIDKPYATGTLGVQAQAAPDDPGMARWVPPLEPAVSAG